MLEKLKYTEKPYTKKNFSASDFDKWDLELFFAMTGEPVTNPKDATSSVRLTTGSAIEDAVMELYKMNGIVEEFYDQDYDGRMEMVRCGVKVTGYMDAVTQKNDFGLQPNVPIEIKSINNNNKFDVTDYNMGKPRPNYVGQLSTYMDFKNTDVGYLQVVTIDGLQDFFFECRKIGEGLYQCGETIVNIAKEYERWAQIQRMIDEGKMPNVFGYRYKYPLAEIDWKSLSSYKIQKMRSGIVLGDWQIQYSPWKDKIIQLQGDVLGYTEEEMEIIKSKTTGYTTWSKVKK